MRSMVQVVVSRSARATSSRLVSTHLAGVVPVVSWNRREKLRVLMHA